MEEGEETESDDGFPRCCFFRPVFRPVLVHQKGRINKDGFLYEYGLFVELQVKSTFRKKNVFFCFLAGRVLTLNLRGCVAV